MSILAIDPGNIETGWMIWNPDLPKIVRMGKDPNAKVREVIIEFALNYKGPEHQVWCEMVACYGMPVGAEVFDTCVWIGEFRALCRQMNLPWNVVTRLTVKTHHCHSAKAGDPHVRQALLDRFADRRNKKGELCGGSKKDPGRLYDVTKDKWAALAIAVYAADKLKKDTSWAAAAADKEPTLE
jgi:hypothetical protein